MTRRKFRMTSQKVENDKRKTPKPLKCRLERKKHHSLFDQNHVYLRKTSKISFAQPGERLTPVMREGV